MLQRVVDQFQIKGECTNISLFGNGHIHDTYKVVTHSPESPNYLLQKVNTLVFPRVAQMMDNISRVTQHIQEGLNQKDQDISRKVLQVIPTSQGSFYFRQEDSYWRMFLFVEEASSFESPQNLAQSVEAGRSLAQFQRSLIDFPAISLHETIPHFHDVKRRLRKFRKVLKADPLGRAKGAEQEIQVVKSRGREMSILTELMTEDLLPVRVTHNDTKFNNLLFDRHGKALLWVDLDTVMPGCVHFDFGDAIRVLANTGNEDEEDISRVAFDFEQYKAFTKGYLTEIGNILAPVELIHLAFSPKMMTFIMGLRFLTDFLEGDTYYKTSFERHNLVRSKSQFQLLSAMDEAYAEMKAFAASCYLT